MVVLVVVDVGREDVVGVVVVVGWKQLGPLPGSGQASQQLTQGVGV